MTAARTGSAASIKVLASHGANVNVQENWMGESPLSWAAAENHADAVKALIELGADVNKKSKVLSFPNSSGRPRGWSAPPSHAEAGRR
jgi:ankyrin repeat protein